MVAVLSLAVLVGHLVATFASVESETYVIDTQPENLDRALSLEHAEALQGENDDRRTSLSTARYIGCFYDTPDRALPYFVGFNVPFNECREACQAHGYRYFGRQGKNECWCGGTERNEKPYAKHGEGKDCKCVGKFHGTWRQCVYDIGYSAKPMGCFKDDAEDRALKRFIGRGMSFSACMATCQKEGYYYFGRQSWGECYCGGSDYDKYGEVTGCRCDYRNIGARKNCVYKVHDVVGCYNDTLERALPHFAGKGLTHRKCYNACKEAGFHFMGKQGVGECYCGGNSPVSKTYAMHGETTGCKCAGMDHGKWKMCVHQIFYSDN